MYYIMVFIKSDYIMAFIFKEKNNFFKMENTLLCLKENFKKKNSQSVSTPLWLRGNIFFFIYSPDNVLQT